MPDVKRNNLSVRGDSEEHKDFKYGLCDKYSYCIDANYHKGITFEYFLRTHRRQLVIERVK